VEVSIDEADDEKFKTLENELEIEKNNTNVQSEKISNLKVEMS
jgi:hypothetical protein